MTLRPEPAFVRELFLGLVHDLAQGANAWPIKVHEVRGLVAHVSVAFGGSFNAPIQLVSCACGSCIKLVPHEVQLYRSDVEQATAGQGIRWLILIHQFPPKPNYLRVTVGRRLARIGAVALKNTVYVLPRTESAREDFQWVPGELVAVGGETMLLEAVLIDGLGDAEVEGLFREARDADYAGIAAEARELEKHLPERHLDEELRRQEDAELQRLERRLEEIVTIDFDLKDDKFGRPEVAGLAAQLAGFALLNRTEPLSR